ncbi:MAG: ferredoxin--NADP reductase [Haloarculaceae archaeon]
MVRDGDGDSVPRHMDAHERAERMPLVTDEATVTLHEAMDRSRNRDVLAAIREHLEHDGDPAWLDAVKEGADYDWDALSDRLEDADASRGTVDAIETLADRFERPYPSLLRLGVDPDTVLEFSPGQYVTLRARGTPRAYSIASSPSKDDLEFAIRRVPGGRLTSDLFVNVDVGDEVVVRGPNGDMVLEDPAGNDVVFLATGTGVAPFKSMIDYLFEAGWDEHAGEKRDVWLLLGCGWEDDLPYRERFRELDAERENFHFVPTLSRESLLTDWEGETNYVQQLLVTYLADDALEGVSLPRELRRYRDSEPKTDVAARIDPANTDLYACGITAMVETLVRAARAVGIPDDQMQFEGFG